MQERNCINCGAPIELKVDKCPYCGTSYFNICNLVLDGHTPIALRFKTNVQGKEGIFTALVVGTENVSLNSSCDHTKAYYGGACVGSYIAGPQADINLEFRVIPNSKKELFTMEIQDKV